MSATFAVPAGKPTVKSLALQLEAPEGWTVTATTPVTAAKVIGGRSFTATWRVTAPSGELRAMSFLQAVTKFRQPTAARSISDVRAVRAAPAMPAGDRWVSDLPFLSSANGWGPIERDKSNGEDSSGDGKTITIGGTTYAKGLGVHAASSASVYLGGACTRFTAVAGVDDEVGDNGTVRFRVLVDGVEAYASSIITGSAGGTEVSVDVTGGQQLDLAIDNGGDDNSYDHADWANAKITCS